MSGSPGSEAPSPAAPVPAPGPARPRPLQLAGLFGILLLAYHLNFDFNPVSDSIPNLFLSKTLVTRGALSFSPEELPFMFSWQLRTPRGDRTFKPASWDSTIGGRRAIDLYREGSLASPSPKYYLVPSVTPGRYVGIYGPGAGLSALPCLGPVALLPAGRSFGALGYAGKTFASLCVAGSAVFVCLALARFVASREALALGLVYGLGTCVWSESSQALWQQTPALFFVAWGTYLLLRAKDAPRPSALAGLAYGAALLCRPSLALLFLGGALYLAFLDFRSVLRYLGAGVWPVLVLLAYNTVELGMPFRTGHTEAAGAVARSVTGSEDLWQTPLWVGAAGVLLSPSRGLLVYSPFLAFSFWGAVRAWRRPAPPEEWPLRVLGPVLAALLIVSFKWFSWWGGAAYGYRVIVELTPLLMALIGPVAGAIAASKPLRRIFLSLSAWSIGVQALGAFAYFHASWNAPARYELEVPGRPGTVTLEDPREATDWVLSGRGRILREMTLNVDLPENRSRLWSIAGCQILYYLDPRGFAQGRRDRRREVEASFTLK